MKQAACVFIAHQNQVVLTTRRGGSDVGLPGGKSDEGETPIESAIREVYEETNIRVEQNMLKRVYSGVCKGDGPNGEDYFVTCFKYNLPINPHEIKSNEDGITAFLGDVSQLITNSPFGEFNNKLLAELGYINQYFYLDEFDNIAFSTEAIDILMADGKARECGHNPMKLRCCIGGKLIISDVTTSHTVVLEKERVSKGKMVLPVIHTTGPKPITNSSMFANSIKNATIKYTTLIEKYRYSPIHSIQWEFAGGRRMFIRHIL